MKLEHPASPPPPKTFGERLRLLRLDLEILITGRPRGSAQRAKAMQIAGHLLIAEGLDEEARVAGAPLDAPPKASGEMVWLRARPRTS